MQLQSKHDSATSFVDAGNAYKKADPQGKATEWLCVTDQHRFLWCLGWCAMLSPGNKNSCIIG